MLTPHGLRNLAPNDPAYRGTDLVVDSETGSQWDRYGECIAGKLKGQYLQAIVPEPSFWFYWAGFYSKTEICAASTGSR